MYITNLTELLDSSVRRAPDSPAVISGDEVISYRQLAEQSRRIAAWLILNGLQRRDRVGIYMRKSIPELSATLGISMVGGVFVNINPQWTVDQADYIRTDCQIELLIADKASVKKLELSDQLNAFRRVLVVDEDRSMVGNSDCLSQVAATGASIPYAVIDADLAALLYTSGSTGKPKGVMVTHRNLIDGAQIVSRYLGIRGSDRLLGLLPLSFDYGLNQFLCSLLNGATLVLQSVAMPSEILTSIEKHQVTCMAGVPPVWIQLCRLLQESGASLPSLRLITNSGGKIPKQYLEQLATLLPDSTEIFLMYGLTEAFRSTFLSPSQYKQKLGSMGKAIPNVETYVVSHDGSQLCERGEHGELVHRGALISLGYWGMPEATRDRIRPCPAIAHLAGDEEVVYSGDIVFEDEEGYLWFVERKDSMIKSSGFRISTTEIEEVLYQHESVLEAVAFGAPNDELGQEVRVAIQISELSESSEPGILRHCRASMPNYMVPRRVFLVPSPFPRTASGKLDRPAIKSMFSVAD